MEDLSKVRERDQNIIAQIMNRRPQPTEFTIIIETIRMFINSRDTPFTIREIQSFLMLKLVSR